MNPANTTHNNKALPVLLDRDYCPSCGEQAHFTFLGEQRWPEKVAQALGIPTLVQQWICSACHTTFTEPEMQ